MTTSPVTPNMSGRPTSPFSALVRNHIAAHGLRWAVQQYRVKHGLTALEFRIFAGV